MIVMTTMLNVINVQINLSFFAVQKSHMSYQVGIRVFFGKVRTLATRNNTLQFILYPKVT